MKLKNKKTGEIGYLYANKNENYNVLDENDKVLAVYETLEAVVGEWQDYEEPKEYWYMDYAGFIRSAARTGNSWEVQKKIGNCFETKEEAEKAVEKLKAWKRLKDKGFRFKDYTRKFDGFKRVDGSVFIIAELDDEGVIGMIDELNICFGGEE